jgi:hypothetical protein
VSRKRNGLRAQARVAAVQGSRACSTATGMNPPEAWSRAGCAPLVIVVRVDWRRRTVGRLCPAVVGGIQAIGSERQGLRCPCRVRDCPSSPG